MALGDDEVFFSLGEIKKRLSVLDFMAGKMFSLLSVVKSFSVVSDLFLCLVEMNEVFFGLFVFVFICVVF